MTEPAKSTSAGKVGAVAAVVALCGGLVAHYEGYSPTGYADPIGIPTACIGHTGDGIKVGKTYSAQQCDLWLDEDLREAALTVDRCITSPMKVYQWAALTSATFNAGPKLVCGSTLQRYANAGNWAQACAQLDRWVYAGGIKFRGLVKRRAAERAMCEGREWA